MKKLLVAILLLIISFGCNMGPGAGDPKTVLSSFFDALEKKDIATARKYATKESDMMLNMIETAMKMAPDSIKHLDYNKKDMQYGEVTIVGDKATVPVKDLRTGEASNFTLKKEDGNWKVAFDKVTMSDMAKERMKKEGGKKMHEFTDSTKKMMDELNKAVDSIK